MKKYMRNKLAHQSSTEVPAPPVSVFCFDTTAHRYKMLSLCNGYAVGPVLS